MWAGDSFADGPAVCFAQVRKHQRDAADIFHRRSEASRQRFWLVSGKTNLLDSHFNDGSVPLCGPWCQWTSRHYNGDNHGACAPMRIHATCPVCKQAHGGTRFVHDGEIWIPFALTGCHNHSHSISHFSVYMHFSRPVIIGQRQKFDFLECHVNVVRVTRVTVCYNHKNPLLKPFKKKKKHYAGENVIDWCFPHAYTATKTTWERVATIKTEKNDFHFPL